MRRVIASLILAPVAVASDCGPECIGQFGDEEATLLQLRSSSGDESDLGAKDVGDRHPSADKAEGGKTTTIGESGDVCDGLFSVFPYGRKETARWGTNFHGWEACAGKSQSPINILPWCWSTKRAKGGERLQTDYVETQEPLILRNNGHAPSIDADFGTLTLASGTYEAYNLHFHHPSEHTINWKAAQLEMHIVHRGFENDALIKQHGLERSPNTTSVVGILFDIGRENKCLSDLFSRQFPIAGCERRVASINVGKCFEHQLNGGWWSYNGSLTTPPCTEGVYWNVMQRRSEISREQLGQFKAMFLDPARPAQDLNGRSVLAHERK